MPLHFLLISTSEEVGEGFQPPEGEGKGSSAQNLQEGHRPLGVARSLGMVVADTMAMMPEAHRACIHMAPGSQPLDWSRGHCFSGGPHRGPGVSWVAVFSPSSVRSPLSSVTLSLRVNQAFTHPLSILRHRREPHVLLGHPTSPRAPLDPLASWSCPTSPLTRPVWPHSPCPPWLPTAPSATQRCWPALGPLVTLPCSTGPE